METKYYHGYMYQIEYKKELSNSDYTQHHVYHIVSTDYHYGHAHKAIEALMDDGSWRKSEWLEKSKNEPSMVNHLHPYHEFSYDEDLDVYVYTLVIPYDD